MSIYGEKIGVKMSKLLIVGDADAIIAQTDPQDVHHQKATTVSGVLKNKDAQIIYPVTAVLEAATHMQRVLNSTASAYETAVVFSNPNIQIAEVNQDTLKNALNYFSPKTSKKNTLFDCIVAAVAEENKADAIFSFDKFYKTKSFKKLFESGVKPTLFQEIATDRNLYMQVRIWKGNRREDNPFFSHVYKTNKYSLNDFRQ